MKRYILILSIAFSALVSCTKEPQWEPMLRESKQEPEAYKSGVLLVKFTPEVVAVLEEQGECFAGALTRSGAPALDEILALLGDCRLERVFQLNVATEAKTREAGLHQWYVVRFDEKYEVAQVAARMRQLGEGQQVDLTRTVKRAYNGKAPPLEVQKGCRCAVCGGLVEDDGISGGDCCCAGRGNLCGSPRFEGQYVGQSP